jgi:potassium efflux system protein
VRLLRRLAIRSFFATLIVCSALSAWAQSSPAPGTSSPVSLTTEVVKSRIDEVEASTALDDTTRATLLERYRKAITHLEAAKAYEEATTQFKTAIEASPAETERIRADLEEREAAPPATFDPDNAGTLSAVERQLSKEKANLVAVEAKLSEFRNQIEKEKDRPAAIRLRLKEAKQEMAGLEAGLLTATAPDEIAELGQAQQWTRETRLEQLRAEILMLDQELLSQPMRVDLLKAQRDLNAFNAARIGAKVEALEQTANQMRSDQTEQAKATAQAAERAAASKHPLVADLAARNTRLTEEIDALADAIEGIGIEETRAGEEASKIEDSYSTTRQKIEVAGLSHVLGQVLHEQRRSLPDERQFARQTHDREERIATVTLSQLQLEEEYAALGNIRGYVDDLTATLQEEEKAGIEDELATLADSRRNLIGEALDIQRAYLAAMGELDFTQRRLQDIVEQFNTFLDKRLLWIRSAQPAGFETAKAIPGQVASLLSPEKWRNLMHTLAQRATSSPWIFLAIVAAAYLVYRRPQLKAGLKDSGKNVGRLTQDRLSSTLLAFWYVMLLAAPMPLLLLSTGWELRAALDASEFTKEVGLTLMMLAPLLLDLHGLRVMAAPGSICAVHFGWRDRGLEQLVRDLRWFTPAVLVAGFIASVTLRTADQTWGTGVGRLAFVALMAIFTVFFYRLSKPDGGTLSILLSGNQQSTPFQLRRLWFVLLVFPPIVAAGVSLAGYVYTAGTLIDHILQTVWFTLGVVIVHQFFQRWLLLNQRKLKLEAARARRRVELESREAQETPEDSAGVLAHEVAQPEIDLQELDTKSRKLMNNAHVLAGLVGFWAIWDDMLPALRILDDVTLWTYTKSVGGVEEQIPITLASIGLAVLITFVTVIAVRQLPALIEIVLLQRMKLAPGARYTVTTLTKYTVTAVGIAWVFSTLGGSWSEIQWIFAALGVGIGFGLQEIVANFISGLIILFERPIRVGDIVTVGNTDGVVTRIQIRATTIRNWNRQELLVPNKNFITQELLNWSLSDQTTRVLIRVGIAYGSDVQRAMLIMEEVAAEHERVMEDPAPFVVFEEFGDNALLLSLRCYIDDLDYRLRITSELNEAINERMTDAGITIAFPQRDLHLDTLKPLDIRIHRSTQAKSS